MRERERAALSLSLWHSKEVYEREQRMQIIGDLYFREMLKVNRIIYEEDARARTSFAVRDKSCACYIIRVYYIFICNSYIEKYYLFRKRIASV